MKKKTLTHAAGGAVTVGSGFGYANLVTLPFGFSFIYFQALGPLAGYLGFEFGRWIGSFKKLKPAALCVFALVIAPCAFWGYDLALHVASPSLINSLLIFLLFSAAIFFFGAALGVIELKIENLRG
jgi:hypothetical protein